MNIWLQNFKKKKQFMYPKSKPNVNALGENSLWKTTDILLYKMPLNLNVVSVPNTLCTKWSGVIMSSFSNLILSRVSLIFCCRLFLPSSAQGANMKY